MIRLRASQQTFQAYPAALLIFEDVAVNTEIPIFQVMSHTPYGQVRRVAGSVAFHYVVFTVLGGGRLFGLAELG